MINLRKIYINLNLTEIKFQPRHATEEETIEHEARERVATMVQRSMGASYDRNISPLSLITDSFDGSLSLSNQSKTKVQKYLHQLFKFVFANIVSFTWYFRIIPH